MQCPYDFDQINFATGWSNYSDFTPDYFNSCTSNGWVNVPYNAYGYQIPATGNAYGGVGTYGSHWLGFLDAREFIGRQLSSPLIIGTKYYVSFGVGLGFLDSLSINCATNHLGILFSTVAYSTTSPAPISNYAHVYTDSIITDTANWVTISGSFTADSAYNYVVFGNFFDDSNTDTLIMNDSIYCNSFYYVDDICVSIDSTCYVGTGITSIIPKSAITIFPNPTNGDVYIKLNEHGKAIVNVYSVMGKLITTANLQQISSNEYKIDLSSQPDGIYFINTRINETIKQQKILLIH